MKKILILILIIIVTLNTYSQSPTPKILGVVMGISKYMNVPSLQYADRDALSFYEYLLSPAGGKADTNNIRLLLNEKATSYNFFEAMDNLLDAVKEGDVVYIYFAGHGDIEKKTERQNGFLIGYNAPPNCYAAGGSISVRFLQDYVETLVSKNKSKVILIVDACRSGKLAGGNEGAEITALALKQEWKGVTKILSCQPGEKSLEGDNWGGGAGVFTYFLLRGLKGQADEDKNNNVSLMELSYYLDKIVPKETDNKQMPEVVGDKRQDIAKVDKETYLAMLNKPERQTLISDNIQSEGFRTHLPPSLDVSVVKAYEKFKYYISTGNLIAYSEDDLYKENAFSIYKGLETNKNAEPIIKSMKGELLAALQNKAQTTSNNMLNSIIDIEPASTKLIYKELKASLELVDSTYKQYNNMKSKCLFWSGLILDKNDSNRKRIFEECIKIDPDFPGPYVMIAIYLSQKGNHSEAMKFINKSIELTENWALGYLGRAFMKFQSSDFGGAKEDVEKALELKPDFPEALYIKGLFFIIMKNYNEAIKYLDRAIDLKSKFGEPYAYKGFALGQLGRNEEAIVCFDKAIAVKPDNYEAITNKGISLSSLGKNEEAILCFDKAISIKSDYIEAWYGKGWSLTQIGKKEDAIVCYDKVLEIKPNIPGAWLNKGIILMSLKDYEKADKCFDKAIELKPDYYEAWENRGVSFFNQQKYEEAVKCIDKTIELKPNNANAWRNKGSTLVKMGKYEEAIKSNDKAIELKPDYYDAMGNRGYAYYKLGNYEEAIKSYDKAIELKPDYYQNWHEKANSLLHLKKYEEAIKCYKKAIELKPDYSSAWYNMACMYSLLKNKDDMLKSLKRAIELNSKYKEDAKKDEDFKEYWEDPDFKKLVE